MSLERTARTLHLMEKDKKTPQDRITILNKELAQVAYELLQARIFPGESPVREANAKLELGDAMVQIHMLCYDMGLRPEDVLKLGVQHTFERFQDFDARGWGKAQEPEPSKSESQKWSNDRDVEMREFFDKLITGQYPHKSFKCLIPTKRVATSEEGLRAYLLMLGIDPDKLKIAMEEHNLG